MDFEGFIPTAAPIIRSSPGPEENYLIRQAVLAGKSEDEVLAMFPDIETSSVRNAYQGFEDKATSPEAAAEVAEQVQAAEAEAQTAQAKVAAALDKAKAIDAKRKAKPAPVEQPPADPLE